MARFQDSFFDGGYTGPALVKDAWISISEETIHRLKILATFPTTIFTAAAYNARMVRLPNPIPVSFSPLQHARMCFFLAVILFLLAAGAVYWNESAHYHIYLALGVVFAVLGFVPLVMHAWQHKSK
jgi:Ni,Fe-hydrogenase I cytochrome b subunit